MVARSTFHDRLLEASLSAEEGLLWLASVTKHQDSFIQQAEGRSVDCGHDVKVDIDSCNLGQLSMSALDTESLNTIAARKLLPAKAANDFLEREL